MIADKEPMGTAPMTAAYPPVMPTTTNNLGRDKVHWTKDIWDRIDKAVYDEMMRTRVAAQFLPIRRVLPRTTSVPTDSITPTSQSPTLSVDEGLTTRLNESYGQKIHAASLW